MSKRGRRFGGDVLLVVVWHGKEIYVTDGAKTLVGVSTYTGTLRGQSSAHRGLDLEGLFTVIGRACVGKVGVAADDDGWGVERPLVLACIS